VDSKFLRRRLSWWALTALLLAAHAAAQPPARPVTLTWTAPTQNTDGTPLTNLAGFRVYWGTQRGAYPISASVPSPDVTTYIVSGLTPGVRYYFVATARNASGVESAFSNEATAVAAADEPAPPTGLTTPTPDLPVYAPFLTRNAQSMIQVGVAPAGVPCDGTQSARGYGPSQTLYLVPVEQVRLYPGTQPEAVFAACAPGTGPT
jgi:hypothetical protein